MTIRKGDAWGAPGGLPSGRPVFDGDRELALAAVAARATGEAMPIFGVAGGDLHRTIGAPPRERMDGPEAMRLPIDLVRVELDDTEDWFVAHLVAGRGPWFRGRTVVAMNAAFVGGANLGPRAHPGDGLVDVTDGRLGLRDRLAARPRYGSGTHLPHPALGRRRIAEWSTTMERAVPVRLDGEPIGSFRRLRAVVIPDALVVVA